MGQETKDFMLPAWLQDIHQEDKGKFRSTGPGLELGLTWQEAQAEKERFGRTA